MIIKGNENAQVLQFDSFKDIKHCFSTKNGGVSTGISKGLNLGYLRDDLDNVLTNFSFVANIIGFDINKVALASQMHGDKIAVINEGDYFHAKEGFALGSYDGLITNLENVCLITFHADCIPIYLYDPVKRVVGLAHSGWMGTNLKIAPKLVKKMQKTYDCDINDIKIAIGPGLERDCFEVDEPVYLQFKKSYKNIDDFSIKKGHKYYIDLKEIIKYSLVEIGIDESKIEISDLCTKCEEDLFYSHRRQGYNRGSMAAFILLG